MSRIETAAIAWHQARLRACAAPLGDASIWTDLGAAETALSKAVSSEPGRALTVEVIWEAFAASDRHGSGYVAGLQAEVEEDEECQPTGKRYTLIDGYFDLERVAEILNGRGTSA